MNAGELVVSLILNVNRFKAQLQDAQREFDTVQAVAHSAGTGISEASEKSAAAISEISASARDAGPGSVSNVNNSSRQTVFNNDIEIVTQATDGQGVANDLDKVWRSQTFQSDSAFGY